LASNLQSSSVTPENIYFAVKTCAKYHLDRISVIKKLWAKYDLNIGYFSDAAGMIDEKLCIL